MKCIIVAAGYATRLYPLTENFPKPLLKIKGKTILDWLLDDLDQSQKIQEYVVVSNHRYFEHYCAWNKRSNLKVIDDGTSTNERRLGALKDMELAIEKEKIEEDCLVMAGDNVLDFSLLHFMDYFERKNHSCVMSYVEEDIAKLRRSGVAILNEQKQIIAMEEKPLEPKGKNILPPFYLYKKEDLALLKKAIEQGCNCDAPGSFVSYLCDKTKLYAYTMPGKRYDIGNLESYQNVCESYRGIIL